MNRVLHSNSLGLFNNKLLGVGNQLKLFENLNLTFSSAFTRYSNFFLRSRIRLLKRSNNRQALNYILESSKYFQNKRQYRFTILIYCSVYAFFSKYVLGRQLAKNYGLYIFFKKKHFLRRLFFKIAKFRISNAFKVRN